MLYCLSMSSIMFAFMYHVKCIFKGVDMSALDRIKSALSENHAATAAELAQHAGVSRQRVYQICKAAGITLSRAARPIEPRQWSSHFGLQEKLSSHFIGGASECSAAADLLRKGIPVYRAMTFVSSADLVIDRNGELLRVEVRSAKRNINGTLRYPMPIDRSRYDVLALVEPDGAVTYKPPLFGAD